MVGKKYLGEGNLRFRPEGFNSPPMVSFPHLSFAAADSAAFFGQTTRLRTSLLKKGSSTSRQTERNMRLRNGGLISALFLFARIIWHSNAQMKRDSIPCLQADGMSY